jgi:hypothetical protein
MSDVIVVLSFEDGEVEELGTLEELEELEEVDGFECWVCGGIFELEEMTPVNTEMIVCNNCECLKDMVRDQAFRFNRLRYAMDRALNESEEG